MYSGITVEPFYVADHISFTEFISGTIVSQEKGQIDNQSILSDSVYVRIARKTLEFKTIFKHPNRKKR